MGVLGAQIQASNEKSALLTGYIYVASGIQDPVAVGQLATRHLPSRRRNLTNTDAISIIFSAVSSKLARLHSDMLDLQNKIVF